MNDSSRRQRERQPSTDEPFPAAVDWLLGAVIALGGMLALIAGSAITFFVDRDVLAEGIEDEVVTVTIGTAELTEQEQLDVADAVLSWLGVGTLLTGLALVLFGLGYIYLRHRTRKRSAQGLRTSTFLPNAVLGGVGTALLSFLPLSPALGGALAGYFERPYSDKTISVGAVAGVLPIIPLLVVMLSFIGGLTSGLLSIGEGGIAVVASLGIFFALMITVTVGAVLGALGGYLAGRFAERGSSSQEFDSPPRSNHNQQSESPEPADAFQPGEMPDSAKTDEPDETNKRE